MNISVWVLWVNINLARLMKSKINLASFLDSHCFSASKIPRFCFQYVKVSNLTISLTDQKTLNTTPTFH